MYAVNSKAILEARLESGLNVSDVTKKTGIARSTIDRLENREVLKPRASTLHKLAMLYNKSISNFLERGES